MADEKKRCLHCRENLPLSAFWRKGDRWQDWCKVCSKTAVAAYQKTERYRRWRVSYQARPEVTAAHCESLRRQRLRRKGADRE